ncbi:MAG: protein-L-isoaspartate O-methyltransferase family protein [Burkholderiaceae bacterium]
MDFERARFNMIEQQIRPWDVLDQTVLDLLSIVKREDFVAPTYRTLAFSDLGLPILLDGEDTGEVMLAPKVEARLLQELMLTGHESVLEIGTGTGYMAALLAHRANDVISAELLPELVELARNNLQRANVLSVSVVQADAALGLPGHPGGFDRILVSGSMPLLPPSLLAQLKVGGHLAAIVGEMPVMQAQIVSRIDESRYSSRILFETIAPSLKNAPLPPRFQF